MHTILRLRFNIHNKEFRCAAALVILPCTVDSHQHIQQKPRATYTTSVMTSDVISGNTVSSKSRCLVHIRASPLTGVTGVQMIARNTIWVL